MNKEILDNIIYGRNLSDEELRNLHLYPVKFFAYKIVDEDNYEQIKGGLAILQRMQCKSFYKDIFYILDKTQFSRFQKIKLNIQFLLF
jgi:hypothetical protein